MSIDDGISGDDEAAKWTLGLNYIPVKNIRLMLNYDKVTKWDQDGVDQNAEPSAIKFRAQAKW
jgi:phosphate-selective porin